MEGQLAVPFHFAVEFLVLVVVAGAALDALRKARRGAGGWAYIQALGFVALGVSQATHGAQVFEADGDRVVLGLRTAGFLILALSARPGGVEPWNGRLAGAGVVAPALFVPGIDADWAFIPAIAAAAVAVRGIAAHRRDQDPTTFAFSAGFIAFAASEALTVLSPPQGGGMLAAAHALRAAAALLLARWLWSSIVRSIRMRFVAAFVVVLSLLVLVIAGALNLVIGDTIADEELKRLQAAGEARVATIRNLGQAAVGSAGQFAGNPTAALVLRQSNEAVAAGIARQAFQLLPANSDLIMLVDRNRRVLGSAEPADPDPTPLPEGQSIRIAGSAVVEEALTLARPNASPQAITFASGTEGEVVSQVIVLGAAPSRCRLLNDGSCDTTRGPVVGAIIIGYRIDEQYLAEIKQDTGAEASLIVGSQLAGSTLGERAAVERGIEPFQEELRRAREDREVTFATVEVEGISYVTSFLPLLSEDRQVAGVLALARRADVLAEAQRDIARTLFLITLAAVAVAALLAWVSGGRVTKPLRSLTAAARQLREGEFGARARVGSGDEVGTLGTAFNEMADELQRTTGALRTAAVEEASLRARMEAILESMGDGLIATDARGAVVTCNGAAAEMIGRKPEWAVGRPLGEVLDGGASTGRPLASVALAGRSAQGSLRGARGRVVPVAITSAPLRDPDGDEAGRVVVMRDISVEQQAERMKSEFLSNVSHELRTPITPIKGYAEIMRRKKFPREKAEQFLEGILESTGRLERIVEILVDFAAIEAGRLQPRTQAIPVRALMNDLALRWQPRGPKHRFVRKGGSELPPVLGDPKLLQRSLDELMDNAVKFSPDGGRIEIIAESSRNGTRAGKAKLIRLTVRDHGIGIDPERMPDLFQDFRQLDGSETRTFGGLGLGLAYVKRIATVHGGDIEVASQPGKGSAFTLVLPAADTRGKTARRPSPQAGSRRTTTAAPRRRKATTKKTTRRSR